LADLGAIGIKAMSSLKDNALTFQGLKLGGGILSAASAWWICQEDYKESEAQGAKGNEGVAYLYALKGTVGAVGGAFSLMTGATYTQPAFALIAKKFPASIIGRAAAYMPQLSSRIAGHIMLTRAALMMCGIYISIAIIAIQLLIWKYSDDALQDWCDRCAFGRQRAYRYGSAKIQMDEFNNLTKET